MTLNFPSISLVYYINISLKALNFPVERTMKRTMWKSASNWLIFYFISSYSCYVISWCLWYPWFISFLLFFFFFFLIFSFSCTFFLRSRLGLLILNFFFFYFFFEEEEKKKITKRFSTTRKIDSIEQMKICLWSW